MFPQVFFSTSEQWGIHIQLYSPTVLCRLFFFYILMSFSITTNTANTAGGCCLNQDIAQACQQATLFCFDRNWTGLPIGDCLKLVLFLQKLKKITWFYFDEIEQACQQATAWTWFCFDRNWTGLPTGDGLNLVLFWQKVNRLANRRLPKPGSALIEMEQACQQATD